MKKSWVLVLGILVFSSFVSAQSLIAEYSFDEGSGNIARDSSGNSLDGVINGASWTTGKYAGALNFDGVNDDVSFLGALFDDLAPKTISMWINPTNSVGYLISKRNGNCSNFWRLSLEPNERIDWFKLTASSPNILTQTQGGAITLNNWTYIAVTWDGTVNPARLYVDGVEATYSTTQTGFGALGSDTGCLLRLGSREGSTSFYSGKIDELRVYDYILTQAEIQTDMSTAINGNMQPPPSSNTGSGDLNVDSVVDIMDILIVVQDIGKTSGFDPRGDVDGNSVVNIFDLTVVARNWGNNYQTNPPPPPPPPLSSFCGDGACDANETCSSCAVDCGSCPAVCGNNIIEINETCDDGINNGVCPANCSNVCTLNNCTPMSGSLPWFEDDFSSYIDTNDLLSNGWYTLLEQDYNNVLPGFVVLDTTTGYGNSSQSMRYDFPDMTNEINDADNDGIEDRCDVYTIGRTFQPNGAAFQNQTHLWFEFVIKFSSNWITNTPASWNCGSQNAGAPDHKTILIHPMGSSSRWGFHMGVHPDEFVWAQDVVSGTAWTMNNVPSSHPNALPPPSWNPTGPYDLNASPYWDDQWHNIRIEIDSQLGGVFRIWVDGDLMHEKFVSNPSTITGFDSIKLGANRNLGASSDMSMWWGEIKVYHQDPGW